MVSYWPQRAACEISLPMDIKNKVLLEVVNITDKDPAAPRLKPCSGLPFQKLHTSLLMHAWNGFFKCETIVWHVDASSVVCTLIEIGKLADQIATLLPIVVRRIGKPYPEGCLLGKAKLWSSSFHRLSIHSYTQHVLRKLHKLAQQLSNINF